MNEGCYGMEAHQFFVQEYIDDMFRRDGPGGPPCEWEWLSSNKGRVSHRNLVVNRILFRFGFGRKFRPKHVSVSAFRLSPVSVIRPKHFFRPKGAVSAKMTILDKRVHIVISYRC